MFVIEIAFPHFPKLFVYKVIKVPIKLTKTNSNNKLGHVGGI